MTNNAYEFILLQLARHQIVSIFIRVFESWRYWAFISLDADKKTSDQTSCAI